MLKPSRFRATLAWAGACLIGIVVGVLGVAVTNVLQGGSWLSIQTFILASSLFYLCAVVFIAPPSLLIVGPVRMARIRRPWGDTVGGALAALIGILAADALADLGMYGHLVGGEPVLFPHALVSGLVGGPAYWWLAGKPNPPYPRAEA